MKISLVSLRYQQPGVLFPTISRCSLSIFRLPKLGEDVEVTKEEVSKPVTKPPPPSSTLSLTLLNSLQELRRRLELAETSLTSHLHIPLGENSVHECSVHIQRLQVCHQSSKYGSHSRLLVASIVIYQFACRACIKSWTPFTMTICK